MFSNLVESTAHASSNRKQTVFFGVTAMVNSLLFVAVFVWSLYSFNLSALGQNEDLSISTLVAPAVMPENEPPVPTPQNQPPAKASMSTIQPKNYDVLKNPVTSINTVTTPPDKVSTVKSDSDAIREKVPYISGKTTARATGETLTRISSNNPNGSTLAIKPQNEKSYDIEIQPPAAPLKAKLETPAPAKKIASVSKGVINGIAKNLPVPIYPTAAKAIRAAGAVNVQVTIDEWGNVVSATALTGHSLLRAAAISAAKQAKFTPTTLSNEPVKVTGVIVYNFVPQ